MVEYFKKFDIEEEYKPSTIMYDHTKCLAQSFEYELGYWMQAFIRLYTPGAFFRACNAFGDLENWMELRYMMEHAIFDPEHPLYSLNYETCSDEDRARLVVFREIARSCCYCGYALLKLKRPNLLPKRERKPLTKKEEKSIHWMVAYYTHSGTAQEREAFWRYKNNFNEIYPRQTPTQEEIDAFETHQAEISRQLKRERRQEAQRREAERLSKLPEITYIAAYPCIKKQFRQVFGSDNEFVVINHQFEFGDFNFRGKLPATQELVVLLSNDARSQRLLRYITTHFHHKISIINIDGHEEEKRNPIELSKKQIQELRLEFETLKNL